MKYQIGQKIYYTGDMANLPGNFEIESITENKYVSGYNLKEIDGENREFKTVFECSIVDVYRGPSGYRFVTKEAYEKYQQEQIEYFNKRYTKAQ